MENKKSIGLKPEVFFKPRKAKLFGAVKVQRTLKPQKRKNHPKGRGIKPFLSNKNKRNLLVTLADENYVEQAKQLFSSVYWNAGWKGDYLLLAHEIPEKKLKCFRDKGILVRKCRPVFENKTINNVKLSKFYLFTPEFKKWKKIVYLDSDIIVKASLDELTKVRGFAAVWDVQSPKLMDQLPDLERNKYLMELLRKKYDFEEFAFNSGVMAFSTDIIEKNIFPRLLKIEEKVKDAKAHLVDQPVFNIYFFKNWAQLPLVYNLYPYLINSNKPGADSIVLHFTKNKPWKSKNFFYEEWKANLEKFKLINLKNIPDGQRWPEDKIQSKSDYCKRKVFFWNPVKDFRNKDRLIGALGIFLKGHSPKLYASLKKTKRLLRME